MDRILRDGASSEFGRYLEFHDGNTRQYISARPSDLCECLNVTFVEEQWTKSGERDVIDQWIVQVAPFIEANHRLLVEDHAIVVEMHRLDPKGAENVVERIAEKAMADPSTRHK